MPKIVIVGAGAAGVFTAYRLFEMYGSHFDIVLLEANDRVGGNCMTTKVIYGDTPYAIDCGAQFFYKNPQGSYTALLEQLGLMDDASEVVAAPAGFTIWDKPAKERRLWLPSRLSGFGDYHLEDWDNLAKFGLFLSYGAFLDREASDWTESVDDWLAKLVLVDDEFKEKVIKPFMYQFVSLPLSRIGEASALYAITYFVRNVFGEPHVTDTEADAPSLPGLPTFQTYQSMIGLDGLLKAILAVTGVTADLSTPVTSVKRVGDVCVVQTASGVIQADYVVLACDPHASAAILQEGGTAPATLIDTLRALEYVGLPISMQRDGASWMPSDQSYWEPVNTIVDGDSVTFTAWFGRLRPTYLGGNQIPVFKSWGSPDLDHSEFEFLAHRHYIPLPTTTFVGLREELGKWQGQDGIWFAGGWTRWFDSQEAALDSATWVAESLPPDSKPVTGSARMIPNDPLRTERRVRRWLERVARQAPEHRRPAIANALEEVASRG